MARSWAYPPTPYSMHLLLDYLHPMLLWQKAKHNRRPQSWLNHTLRPAKQGLESLLEPNTGSAFPELQDWGFQSRFRPSPLLRTKPFTPPQGLWVNHMTHNSVAGAGLVRHIWLLVTQPSCAGGSCPGSSWTFQTLCFGAAGRDWAGKPDGTFHTMFVLLHQ